MNRILLLICFVEFVRDISECCEVGFFGESCSEECPQYCHNNECDRTSGICLSCAKGYYRNNDRNKTCIQCQGNCAACESDNFCFTCKSGFMGTVCKDVCSNCKPNTSCDKITGYCLENCRDGLSGELCDINCDSKCKSCARYYKQDCTSCEDGETGVSCKENCFSRCLKHICNDSDESCTYDCSSENWEGKSCNKTCLTYCKEIVCNITCKKKGRKRSSMFNMNIIVGIILVVAVFIALGIIIIWVVLKRRRKSSKRIHRITTPENITHSQCSIERIEGNDDDGDIDGSLKLLNPTINGVTNFSSPTTTYSSPVKCDKAKDDICLAVENLGSCDNPIFINGDGHTDEYIASFGPVETFINGFDVFWKMVWEERCEKVVVLSSNDAEDRKFHEYFSSKRQHDEFTVTCKKVRKLGKTKYRKRVLKVQKQNQKRKVALFHFLTWSDEDAPKLDSSILDFQMNVNDFSTNLKGPTVVHVSVGEHRRATYIALDSMIKKNRLVNEDDVQQCIANLEKHGLEVIFEQIWRLAFLAHITQSRKTDETNTKKIFPSNVKSKRFGSKTTGNVNAPNNSIDASARVQQTICNSKDQLTPTTKCDSNSKETEV